MADERIRSIMQCSALFRRGIVLPLSDAALEDLVANDVSEATAVSYVAIKADGLFESLWSIGLFADINQRCDAYLDDYEEDLIDSADLKHVLAAVDTQLSKYSSPPVTQFLVDMKRLVMEAIASKRPLLFVL